MIKSNKNTEYQNTKAWSVGCGCEGAVVAGGVGSGVREKSPHWDLDKI